MVWKLALPCCGLILGRHRSERCAHEFLLVDTRAGDKSAEGDLQIILKELQESAAAVETAGPPVNSPKAATVPATFAKTGDKHDVVRTDLLLETFATGI